VTTRVPQLTPAPAAEPLPARLRRAWPWGVAAVIVAVLFFVYWRLSWSAAANSDSGSTALQAWDALHGNWLLRGWWMSDVSFYTTEIPQYMLLELLFGLGPGAVHIAAAMTYTLIVVLVALLAQGRARGGEGWARAALAGALVASPQVSGALILLLGPDHTGTVVPVLATWLVIDRARPRWYVPVVVGVMLTWIMAADSVVLFTGIGPVIIAAALRALRPGERARRWYELSLAAAAAIAAGVGLLIPKVIVRLGGFQLWHFQTHTMPLSRLPHDSWDTVQAVLQLFGADPVGAHPLIESILTSVHIAGVLLAVIGLCVAVARFLREDQIMVPGLAVGIVLELGAFLISIHSSNLASTREIVAVMPLGAVLAGRTLGGPILAVLRRPGRVRAVAAALAVVVAAGYLGGIAYAAAQPSVPSANQPLASWLDAHDLTEGLAAYWEADSVTLDTGGKVTVSSVLIDRYGKLIPYHWESDDSQYNPKLHDVRFVVAGGPAADLPIPGLAEAAIRTFGRPSHIYRVGSYTVLVWNYNILRHLD
jgi:hypothetical protein